MMRCPLSHAIRCAVPGTSVASSSCARCHTCCSSVVGHCGSHPIGFGNRCVSRECSSTIIGSCGSGCAAYLLHVHDGGRQVVLDAGELVGGRADERLESVVDQLVAGVDGDEADHLVGVGAGVQAGDDASEGVADQHVRPRDRSRGEQVAELGDHVAERAWQRHGVAAARLTRDTDRPGTVVGADPGELSDGGQNGDERGPGASVLHRSAVRPPPDSSTTVGLPSPRHSR